jgi:hypothetical protein
MAEDALAASIQMGSYSEVIMNQVNAHKKRVAVYCGSANGSDPAYVAEATALGRAIAAAGLGMVYGGANIDSWEQSQMRL